MAKPVKEIGSIPFYPPGPKMQIGSVKFLQPGFAAPIRKRVHAGSIDPS